MLRVTSYGFGEASGSQLKFVLGFRSYGLGFEFRVMTKATPWLGLRLYLELALWPG